MGILVEITEKQKNLQYRKNTEDIVQSQLLDLDTSIGKLTCSEYLDSIATLIVDLGSELTSR